MNRRPGGQDRPDDWDVVVVGSGNAGMSAAHAAREHGARVLVADAAPPSWAGGNSYFSAGAFRTAHPGVPAVESILDDVDTERLARTRLDAYTVDAYRADLDRVTGGRADPELSRILAEESWQTMVWLRQVGLRFRLMYERQSYKTAGVERFLGGLAIGTVDGGKGLVATHFDAAARRGIGMAFDHRLTAIDPGRDTVTLEFDAAGGSRRITAGAVVIAAGGFEADPDRRASHLGEEWRAAKVRGTPYNTGGPLDLLLRLGGAPYGEWSGCHATQWDRNAPDFGDRDLTNRYTKQSYPLGIVVNLAGERFVDEGEDFRNFTYAKYGRAVLAQPEGVAFQIFDAKTVPLLRAEEYEADAVPTASRFEASTIERLAAACGVDAVRLGLTVEQFNSAVNEAPFDPSIKDGKAARGIHPPKSNWAQRIDTAPFVAYAVTGAITFTFGGVRIDARASVIDAAGRPIRRVLAAGELVGGLFYGNYPGGSGLMAGSVFGRRAGLAAAT
jgi:tricarballylate dehydrogenase